MVRPTFVLAVSLILSFSVATGSDEAPEERKLTVHSDGAHATVEIKHEWGRDEEKIRVDFNGDVGLMTLRYEVVNASANEEDKLDVQWLRLVEFRDADADGRFTDADAVVGWWWLGTGGEVGVPDGAVARGAVAWSDFVVEDIQDGNVSGKKIVARGELPGSDAPGTLGLDFVAFEENASANGTLVRPSEVKFDILIEDAPYLAEDTRLAVVHDVLTKLETKTVTEPGEGGSSAESDQGEGRLEYRWKTTATVDDRETVVRVTEESIRFEEDAKETKNSTRVAFAYERGESIVHDPWLGIGHGTLLDKLLAHVSAILGGAGLSRVPLP